jgi:hypothetical protein
MGNLGSDKGIHIIQEINKGLVAFTFNSSHRSFSHADKAYGKRALDLSAYLPSVEEALMMLSAALKALDMLGLDEADTSFAAYCLGRKSTRRFLLIV